MLKLYVDTMIRLDHSAQTLSRRESEQNDEGFVSAETIALAVAGVLIVGGVYTVFRTKLNSAVDDLFTSIGGWS